MRESEPLDRPLVERCYQLAKAERWAVPHDAFAASLAASVRRAFPDGPPSRRQLEAFVGSLHLEDLALACACADGQDDAWDYFVLNYRPTLYRAADATGEPARAREVADSLYAELFGLGVRDGERHSHLRYYHGRSSLATWLRAVLAQRYVDTLRKSARLDQLPDDDSPRPLVAASSSRPTSVTRSLDILQRVIAAVVALLPPRDRLRLRCYYAQELTLAHIGRLLGEHEATVSRNLARTRREIRAQVEKTLRDQERLSTDEIAECFAAAADDPGPIDLVRLLPEAERDLARKEVVDNRSR